jgi:hypothetical protein
MPMRGELVEEIAKEALEAFWKSVASRIPATSGDVSPEQHEIMLEYSKSWIRTWQKNNAPGLSDVEEVIE